MREKSRGSDDEGRLPTKVKANASLDSLKPRFAVEAHLANLFEIETNDVHEEDNQQTPQAEASRQLVEQEEVPVPIHLPASFSPQMYEELSQQNAERHDWIEQLGAQNRSVTGRCYQRIADLRVSTTDPDATIMLHKDGSHLGYQTHYVVDGGKSRIILNVLGTPAEALCVPRQSHLHMRIQEKGHSVGKSQLN